MLDAHITYWQRSLEAHTRNVDANIAGAEAGIGYQFTDALYTDLSLMYAWVKIPQTIHPCPNLPFRSTCQSPLCSREI